MTNAARKTIENKYVSPRKKSKRRKNGNLNKHLANFRHSPKELIDFLEDRVIKQREPIRIISTHFCSHYLRLRQMLLENKNIYSVNNKNKANIFLVGPTGCGKTYLTELLSEFSDIPFIKVSAADLSQTGYIGEEAVNYPRQLLHSTKDARGNYDLEKAQIGVIFIDEIDKIRASNTKDRDVSGRGAQFSLLKMMEGMKIPTKIKLSDEEMDYRNRLAKQGKSLAKIPEYIDTRNIIFILSGAFVGIEDIILKRVNEHKIGFSEKNHKRINRTEAYHYLNSDDLIQYGMIPELVGRAPIVTHFENLEEDDLFQILKNRHSGFVSDFQTIMRAKRIKVRIDDEVLRLVANMAARDQIGTRKLFNSFNQLLDPYLTHLLSFKVPEGSILPIRIRKDMVDGSTDVRDIVKSLECNMRKRLVSQKSQQRADVSQGIFHFVQDFFNEHGVKISFTEDLRSTIMQMAQKLDSSPLETCKIIINEHIDAFLKLAQNGILEVRLNMEYLENPTVFMIEQVAKHKR